MTEKRYNYAVIDQECEELKPCPFCGDDAELENNGIFVRVLCRHCEIHQTDYFPECEKEAIEAWNTRPLEDEMHVVAKSIYNEIEKGRMFDVIMDDPLVENGLTHPKNLLRRIISKLEASLDVPLKGGE